MKSLLCVFVVSLLTGCAISQSEPRLIPPVNLPAFVDEPEYRPNENLSAPRQKLIFIRNVDAMEEILKHDSAVVRPEMLRRLSQDQPMSLRLIAAAVLVLKNEEEGKQFFIAQSKIPHAIGDVYVTFNALAWSAKGLTGSEADLSWAEDLMIEALQNRTRVSTRAALPFPSNVRTMEREIEIRELAAQYGGFADHVVRMKSQKGLPIILSLLREYPFYWLNTCILYLGRYKDERVGPLLLNFLRKHQGFEHENTYLAAVRAASEMGLKEAVPILLRHLDDEDSYEGLNALADASVIPTIKAALPRLGSYARAEAELTLIHLKGGDVVPALLQLLGRKNFARRDELILWLEQLHDPRSVAAVASTLCTDPKWFIRSRAIRLLAAVKNKEAIQGLISGLGCDHSKLERWKTDPNHDFSSEVRDEIAKALQEITGENFGPDQQRWQLWLDQQKVF